MDEKLIIQEKYFEILFDDVQYILVYKGSKKSSIQKYFKSFYHLLKRLNELLTKDNLNLVDLSLYKTILEMSKIPQNYLNVSINNILKDVEI